MTGELIPSSRRAVKARGRRRSTWATRKEEKLWYGFVHGTKACLDIRKENDKNYIYLAMENIREKAADFGPRGGGKKKENDTRLSSKPLLKRDSINGMGMTKKPKN